MREIDFKKIKGIEGVATYFYSSSDFLKEVVDTKDQIVFYEELKIRKKNYKNKDKHRIVYKAVQQLSQFQKNVARAIDAVTTLPDCVQGFVKKRSSYTNAKQHLARKYLLNADISDFFDSIELNQVVEVFKKLGCDTETANILAKACTLNGILAQGLHSSPAISNLVVTGMDQDFQVLCSKNAAVYTRYADDISISSDTSVPLSNQ
jgi:RNA-directed DNA polymerase